MQNAKLEISNNYDIPECISSKDRGIAIETHKDLDVKEISSQVASYWNGLPTEVVEAPVLAVFERRLYATLKEHEWRFNFKM